MYSLSRSSKEHLEGVDPRLIAIVDRALQITRIDFGIPQDGGIRTAYRQKELCLEGLSMCDGTIKKSEHQSGRAFDVYAYVDGRASWEKEHLAMVAAAILQAAAELNTPLSWGGLWSNFVDMPHFQLL
jgi:peptidoglycan LD-endopeptidase CwlK